jgi:hypothetical protein
MHLKPEEVIMDKDIRKDDCQQGQVPDESYDKTIEDSFPASDPPSSIPAPEPEEDEKKDKAA